MKKIDDYVSTILTSDLSDDTKVHYLKYLNTLSKMSPEQMQAIEDRVYILGRDRLTEKDKLIYEANFLQAYYKSNNLDCTDIRRLYYKISRASSVGNDINEIKMLITQLQLDHGLSIRFYKSYLDLLEKLEKQNNRKQERTFHK